MSFIVNRNDRLNVFVEDLTHDGSGVAKVEGYPLFIPGALPGEEVEIQVGKTLKNYGFAQSIECDESIAGSRRTALPCVLGMWRLPIAAFIL